MDLDMNKWTDRRLLEEYHSLKDTKPYRSKMISNVFFNRHFNNLLWCSFRYIHDENISSELASDTLYKGLKTIGLDWLLNKNSENLAPWLYVAVKRASIRSLENLQKRPGAELRINDIKKIEETMSIHEQDMDLGEKMNAFSEALDYFSITPGDYKHPRIEDEEPRESKENTLIRRFFSIIKQLPELHIVVIKLYSDGYSIAEIGKKIKKNPAYVSRIKYKAVEKVQKLINT